jgi:ribulose-bisphosphate carboxylase large chain
MEQWRLTLSGERLRAVYHITGNREEAEERTRAICIEQTVEVPEEVIPDGEIRDNIVGRLVSLREIGEQTHEAIIDYAIEVAGAELTQLLNNLFGNTSLKPGIRLVTFDLPPGLAAHYKGPRFGRAGLRKLVQVDDRPLLATAIKPMGLSPKQLADLAYSFALGGIDLIKDDHGLADQSFSRFEERVERCAAAVHRANGENGGHSLYLANVTGPVDEFVDRARFAKRHGAGGFLFSAGLTGFDAMRRLADDDSIALPILLHPAFLGFFTTSPSEGISPEAVYGRIARLAGADGTIFPSYGGRFAFTPEQCRAIVHDTECDFGGLESIFPVAGGGMTLERVPEIVEFYGKEAILLIGGDLQRHGPDLVENCRGFIASAREACP